MSGYRRYSKSRYGYRRRRYYSYRYRRYGMSTARKANIAYKSTRKRVKREEVKTHEVTFNSADIGNTVQYIPLAKVPQGNTEDSRIGNSISPTSLRIKLLFGADETNDAPIPHNFTRLFRILIAVWKAEGDPNYNDVIEGHRITGPKNDQYKYNSKILYDKVHRLDSQVQVKYIPITIKRGLRRYPITLQGASSPVTYRMNGYHMWIIPDNSSQTLAADWPVQVDSRLVFKDN